MNNIYKPIHPTGAGAGSDRVRRALELAAAADSSSAASSEELAEADELLRRNAVQVLRQLIRQENDAMLSIGLRRRWFTPEQCQRILKEEHPRNLKIRLLLMNGPRSEDFLDGSFPTLPVGTLAPMIRRWNFRICAQMPAMRLVLGSWKMTESPQASPAGTDGSVLQIHPKIRRLPNGSFYEFRNYLHTLTHCLFQHTVIPDGYDPEIWDIACDIAAQEHAVNIFRQFPEVGNPLPLENQLRQMGYSDLLPLPEDLAANPLYHWLVNAQETLAGRADDPNDDCSSWDILLMELEDRFHLDDHQLWRTPEQERVCRRKLAAAWRSAAASLNTGSHNRRRGTVPGSRQEKMMIREQTQYDFRRYLRRYSCVKEEMQLDLESFDYIPYYYGMQLYGRMPLLEPLEYTEATRVEELVIAIDTSGSCDTATVQRFLSETHNLLTHRENFFRRMQVHIIQCDAMIHEHVIIHSTEEWMQYIQSITIQGRGGTDFTPVFTYVDSLIRGGTLKHLKGLLYFTDGDGIYPKTPTPYETAFVFTTEHFQDFPIPPWAVRLCLDVPDIYSAYHT